MFHFGPPENLEKFLPPKTNMQSCNMQYAVFVHIQLWSQWIKISPGFSTVFLYHKWNKTVQLSIETKEFAKKIVK